jgi:plasmid stabilization system protein ParE
MGLQIVTKRRFVNSLKKTTAYLKNEWSKKVAEDFKELIFSKIELLALRPNVGSVTSIKNVRSVLVGKGFQNRLYYRVEKNKLIIINLKDIRKNPKKNHFA